MPPDLRSGPAGSPLQPSRLTEAESLARTTDVVAMVTENGADDGHARRRWLPVASASLYEPFGRRSWWWISLRCPHCGSVHLHRVREEPDAAGRRRAGCGRLVFVVVRTTYRSRWPDQGAEG